MITGVLKKVFGSKHERTTKRLAPLVAEINRFETEYQTLTDDQLRAKTPEFKEAIKIDPYFNALLIKYGYAITCHKAQGGEWKNCIIDFCATPSIFSKSYFRWCYTALTRCKEKLFCLNEPHIGLTDNLEIVKTVKGF